MMIGLAVAVAAREHLETKLPIYEPELSLDRKRHRLSKGEKKRIKKARGW